MLPTANKAMTPKRDRVNARKRRQQRIRTTRSTRRQQHDRGAQQKEPYDDPVVGSSPPVLHQKERRKASVECHAPHQTGDPDVAVNTAPDNTSTEDVTMYRSQGPPSALP